MRCMIGVSVFLSVCLSHLLKSAMQTFGKVQLVGTYICSRCVYYLEKKPHQVQRLVTFLFSNRFYFFKKFWNVISISFIGRTPLISTSFRLKVRSKKLEMCICPSICLSRLLARRIAGKVQFIGTSFCLRCISLSVYLSVCFLSVSLACWKTPNHLW